MSAPKYTREPWAAVRHDATGSWWVRSSDDFLSISLIGSEESASHPGRANAERIVACVNACAGIADPSVVPEMLAALKEARGLLESLVDTLAIPEDSQAMVRVRAAIAKAEGRYK